MRSARHGRKLTDEYVAGFFDGEGYVGLDKEKTLRVGITNTYLPLLGLIQAEHGGTIYRRKASSIMPSRTLYDWKLNGRYAARFLQRMKRHMIEKRAQAELALAARLYPTNSEMFKSLNEQLKARKRIDHG